MRFLVKLGSLLVALFLIAACASPTGAAGQKTLENKVYAGRINLVVQATGADDPAQSFSGSFELRGNAQTGELDLLTPLGSIAAQLRWAPGMAELIQGKERRVFPSAAALIEQATGAALEPETLLDWLQGKPSAQPNTQANAEPSTIWQVDLSRHSEGRISARRSLPTPAQLRIVLEQP